MPQRRCCIPSCSASLKEGAMLHSFPNPTKESDKFRIWATNAGLLEEDESYVFKNKKICRIHFEEIYHYPKNRLNKRAIPTLHLTAAPTPTLATESVMDTEDILPAPTANILAPIPSTSTTVMDSYQFLQARSFSANILVPIPPTSTTESGLESEQNLSCSSGSGALKITSPTSKNITQEPVNERTHKIAKGRQTTKLSKMEIELHNTVAKTQVALRRCERFKNVYKLKLQMAKKFTRSSAYNDITKDLSQEAKTFFEMQIRQSSKDPKGRRFSIDEKILALTLYKPSPKAYRILSKICVLPKKSTLNKLLSKVVVLPGSNNNMIYEHLKRRVAKMPVAHRFCTIIFDEMAIAPGLYFDKVTDKIKGFSDDGQTRTQTFADHVLVFMIRGILKKYKQPIAFSFCTATTKTVSLKNQLINIIKRVTETGLRVVSTTCDQGSTNMAAINSLINDTRCTYLQEGKEFKGGFFKIGNTAIYPIYDPPHLMKGIRNNMITKNLNFEIAGKKYTAKWEHLEALYRRGPGFKKMRLIPKLTAQHVVPNKIPKMRVKYCVQVFSRTVSIGMGFTAGTGRIPREAKDTAELLLFFDRLFDSINGAFSKPRKGKIYRSAVTPRSPHHRLWCYSLKVLKTMYYIGGRVKVVPSISSFIKTIEAFQKITRKLHGLGIRSLLLRNFNQDPLENFFGAIRAHGHSNTMPSSTAFESAYKSLLINNMVSSQSVGANCEKDNGYCLQSLKYFLEQDVQLPVSKEKYINENHFNITYIYLNELLNSSNPEDLENCAAAAYCGGWLINIIYKSVAKGCEECQNYLEGDSEEVYNKFITLKKYSNKSLLHYPSRYLLECFINIENVCNEILRTDGECDNISNYIELMVTYLIPLDFITCNKHKEQIKKNILTKGITFFINNWCKDINSIIIGKNIIIEEKDSIKKRAYQYYLRSKKGK